MTKEKKKESITDLGEILKRLEGRSGLKALLGNSPELEIKWIPIGIPSLDTIMGGGIPRGRLTIFMGDFSTGKTYLAQKVAASTQRAGGIVVYFNTELKYDPVWWRKTGTDTEKLIVVQGNIGESVLDAVIDMVDIDVDLVILDSVAALVPLAEDEANMEQQLVGTQSRMFSKGFRKLIPALSRSISAILLTNQLRDTIGGVVHMNVTPGGRAQDFYASIKVRVRRGDWIEEDGKRKGFHIDCATEKNVLAPPYQYCSIPFRFTGEIDEVESLVLLAVDINIIGKDGAYYSFGDQKYYGHPKLVNTFRNDKEMFEKLLEAVKKK